LAAPPAAEPQPTRIYRIGVLHPLSGPDGTPHLEAFRQGLRQLGDVEGQNIAIEARYADARADRLPDLAAELAPSKVDIILAVNNPASAAAQRATTTTPIVMAGATDPIGAGFVTALARPGGRITGLSSQFGEAGGKRLQLLREAIPNVSRVAVLWDPTEPGRRAEVSVIAAAARALEVPLQILEARSPQDIDIA